MEQALVEVIGEAIGDVADDRRRALARSRSGYRLRLLCFGTLWTAAVAARFATGEDDVLPSTVVGLVLSSLVWAGLIALFVMWVGGTDRERLIRDRMRGRDALLFLAALAGVLAVPVLAAGWLSSNLGTPKVLAYGLVAGVPGGLLCGLGLRGTSTGRDGT